MDEDVAEFALPTVPDNAPHDPQYELESALNHYVNRVQYIAIVTGSLEGETEEDHAAIKQYHYAFCQITSKLTNYIDRLSEISAGPEQNQTETQTLYLNTVREMCTDTTEQITKMFKIVDPENKHDTFRNLAFLLELGRERVKDEIEEFLGYPDLTDIRKSLEIIQEGAEAFRQGKGPEFCTKYEHLL